MPYQVEKLPERWPLVQTIEMRGTDPLQDARLVNCYAEKNVHSGEYTIYKRPGLSNPIYTPTGGAGLYYWVRTSGALLIYSDASGNIYKNGTLIGTAYLPSGTFRFQEIGSYLVFSDGYKAFYTDATTVTQITDADFPPFSAQGFGKGLAFLNGTLYVLTYAGAVQGSGINDPVNWDPLNVIQANQEYGVGIAIFKHLSYIIALKSTSMEVFYDAGNATGSPLSRLEGGFSRRGCLNGESLQIDEDTAFWISSNEHGNPQIVRMDNLKISVISTPVIDRLIATANNASTFYSAILRIAGHRFYTLDIVASANNLTLVYDIDQNLWYEWYSSAGVGLRLVGATAGYVQNLINGTIFAMNDTFTQPTDAGTPFPVDIYTPNFDAGVDKGKLLQLMRVNTDRVVGSSLLVRHNDYDYDPAKWTNYRTFDLGQKRPFITNEGTFHRRAYHFRHYGPQPFRIVSADLQLALCPL